MSNIGSTVSDTQASDFIEDALNLTAQEIHNYHTWTWLRRKQTFSTVASQESYNLDLEVDRIALLRQLTSPTKLLQLPDEVFYKYIPNPEDLSTGSPLYYRLWAETGFTTNLAAADTVYLASSSASDTSTFKVLLVGRNSNGEIVQEQLTLNGTSSVTSTTTWAADGLLQLSKSAVTTGTLTLSRTTGATTLCTIAPNDITPRSKRISLYPIPSAVITLYLEYYETFRPLEHDHQVPQFDAKWNWVLREGALAKTWEYKQNEQRSLMHQQMFLRGLEQMRKQDSVNVDYVPVLERRGERLSSVVQLLDGDAALVV